jgi:hypothetical protein
VRFCSCLSSLFAPGLIQHGGTLSCAAVTDLSATGRINAPDPGVHTNDGDVCHQMDRLLVTVLLGVFVGVAAAYGENGHGQWVGKGEEQQHASDATAGSVQGKSDTLSSCGESCVVVHLRVPLRRLAHTGFDAWTRAGDVDNCFDCFQQQQCVSNPFGGDPICTPCGWCATSKCLCCSVEPNCFNRNQ